MGIPVLIYGRSGTGKSRALLNFAEDEIFFCECDSKKAPIPKKV